MNPQTLNPKIPNTPNPQPAKARDPSCAHRVPCRRHPAPTHFPARPGRGFIPLGNFMFTLSGFKRTILRNDFR